MTTARETTMMRLRHITAALAAAAALIGCSPAPASADVLAPATTPAASGAEPTRSSGDHAHSEAKWTHPGMKLRLTYRGDLLEPAQKPDGVTLQSRILGTIEDRSDRGVDRPSSLVITVSVRIGGLVDVVRSTLGAGADGIFPHDREDAFHEEPGGAERVEISGVRGYRIQAGSHDERAEYVYASLRPQSTLEVTCSYVAVAEPAVSPAAQREACQQVVSTLAIEL